MASPVGYIGKMYAFAIIAKAKQMKKNIIDNTKGIGKLITDKQFRKEWKQRTGIGVKVAQLKGEEPITFRGTAGQ